MSGCSVIGYALGLMLMLGSASGAMAAVERSAASGFRVAHAVEVAASADSVWHAIEHIDRWWSSSHTWSGDAANLTLEPHAGGCFCERWDGNSAEHARVVFAERGKRLRLRGTLGPLQALAASGVLEFHLQAFDGGTRVHLSYAVAGDPANELDKLAAAVDRVIAAQLQSLAERVDARAGG